MFLAWLNRTRKRRKFFRVSVIPLSLLTLWILHRWIQSPPFIVPREVLDFEAKFIPQAGHLGHAHRIVEQTPEEIKEIVKKHAFNKAVSDQIDVKRELKDYRHLTCKKIHYDLSALASTSVILIFNGEALSALLRTVWSILLKTPESLLKEIILLDDGSTAEDITKVLPLYMRARLPPKVILHRLPSQTGLIQARLAGAKFAKGDVIVFLDSHCEATEGWLPPLLSPIAKDPSTVTIPTIDHISDQSLLYSGSAESESISVGSFTWSGHFSWAAYSTPRSSPADPAPSPTMAGGLFAVSREFFWSVGGYDGKMIGWGGENLEMSFRIWRCHGKMLAVPCSHVGHIFRSFHPYFIPEDSHGVNTVRMAEVWMDDYKRFFYLYRTDLRKNVKSIGDLSDRQGIKDKLQCKSFDWYLKTIIPDKFRMDEEGQFWGRVRSRSEPGICLDHLQRDMGHNRSPYNLGQYPCHSTVSASQYFILTSDGAFRTEYCCGSSQGRKGEIRMVACQTSRTHGRNPSWTLSEVGELKLDSNGKCLTMVNKEAGADVGLQECTGSNNQKWDFEFKRQQ